MKCRNITFVRMNPAEHCTIPWCWFLRGRAYMQENRLVLTFSGFRATLTTGESTKLLEEINLGTVRRIEAMGEPLDAEAEEKANKDGVYNVTEIAFHDDDDE